MSQTPYGDRAPVVNSTGEVIMIPLTQGHFALIDTADYPLVSRWKWCHDKGYAVRKVRTPTGSKTYGMHNQVSQTPSGDSPYDYADPPPGYVVDHINGNGLDNRRCNLRLVPRDKNNLNRPRNHNKRNSRFKGVYLDRRRKTRPWQAEIRLNGQRYFLGCFTTESEAAAVYDRAAQDRFGEYAFQTPADVSNP